MSFLSRSTPIAGNGTNRVFSVTFPYLAKTDVVVYVYPTGQLDPGTPKVSGVDFDWTSTGVITFRTGKVPPAGTVVDIRRVTANGVLTDTMASGGAVRASGIVLNDKQLLYLAQEARDNETATYLSLEAVATTANTALADAEEALATVSTSPSAPTPVSIGLAVAVVALSLGSSGLVNAKVFLTDGYRTVGDGGEAFYRRMSLIEADDIGMLTSADGARLALMPKGPVSPEMFGAYGDDTHNDAAAFAAMESWRIAHRKGGTEYGYSYGSVGVKLLPAKAYYCGTGTGPAGEMAGWNVYVTGFIDTANGSGPSGLSSIIRVDDATSGVIIHSSVSTGNTGYTDDRGYSAVGSVGRGLAAVGGFGGTVESAHHGIHYRIKCTLIDPWADNFPGQGIYGDSFSWDGIHDDNLNGTNIIRPFVRGNNGGIRINLNDANAIRIDDPQMFANRQYGIYASAGVNINITGGNSATNGCVVGWPTQAFNNGHVFGCLPGREAQCSTTSPPSTAVNDANWYYLYDTSSGTASVPQWTARAYRSGGPIRIDGGSEQGCIQFHEVESDQMPILLTGGCKILGFGGANFSIQAIQESGVAYGGFISADSSGIYTGAVVPFLHAAFTLGIPAHRFDRIYGMVGDFATSVIVNGNQVLGSRVAATPAAATDLATVITLANFLRTALQAHGSIA